MSIVDVATLLSTDFVKYAVFFYVIFGVSAIIGTVCICYYTLDFAKFVKEEKKNFIKFFREACTESDEQ